MIAQSIVTAETRSAAIAAICEDKNTPTVLYGAGVYALEVERFLRSHSVNVVGFFVDDEYLSNKHSCGENVFSFEQIKTMFSAFNVVIAFCGYPESLYKKIADLKCDQIKSVRFYDCRFWERFNELSLPYIEEHIDEFQNVYDWLEDDLSKTTFVNYINTKLTFDGEGLQNIRSAPQYFPNDLPMFAPSSNDVFVDGGAYTGDTLAVFLAKTNNVGCKKYYAFEPDTRNAQQLSNYISDNSLYFAEVMRRGLWSHEDVLRFQSTSNTQSLITDSGDIEVKVDSIDHLGLNASFIKMDIEGSELEALKGASHTIRNYRPKLAIAVYHKPCDLLSIPNFIKSLCIDYKFYLRIHSPMSEEMVLYAIARPVV